MNVYMDKPNDVSLCGIKITFWREFLKHSRKAQLKPMPAGHSSVCASASSNRVIYQPLRKGKRLSQSLPKWKNLRLRINVPPTFVDALIKPIMPLFGHALIIIN